MTRKLHKAILSGLSLAALSVFSSQASAVGVTSLGTFDGSSTISYSANSAVKNWADQSIGLGWMHTTQWLSFSVGTTGNVRVTVTDTSAAYTATSNSTNATTGAVTTTQSTSNGNTMHPAFSLFSVGPGGFVGANATNAFNVTPALSPSATGYTTPGNASVMGWDQVDLSASKSGAFLLNGGATGFVGYANSGGTFVNGMGDAVGNGSNTGSALATIGTVGGHDFAQLDLTGLAAGNYLLGLGANCFYLSNCGNEVTSKVVTVTDSLGNITSGPTTTLNPANTWNAGSYNVTVSAVPIPAAVWLFGSAMAGLGVFGRRKDKAQA